MATHYDAELILKLYDLRRETVMRQARSDMFTKFHPKSFEELAAALKPDHPVNVAYRMVSSYWEMAAGLAKHGSIHLELMGENCGEGLILLAKLEPHLERLRKEYSPTTLVNIEWLAQNSKEATRRLEINRKRVAAMVAEKR